MNSKRNWYVLSGDWGGQIYMTIPINFVSVYIAKAILHIIDAVEWGTNEGRGAELLIRDASEDMSILGGLGGGQLEPRCIWIHPQLHSTVKIWVEDLSAGYLPDWDEFLALVLDQNVLELEEDNNSQLARICGHAEDSYLAAQRLLADFHNEDCFEDDNPQF